MDSVLIVIHLIVAVALVVCVLLQRTAQDGGGLMGGGGGSTMGGLFTARGSANLLTRATAVLAALFVAISLLLGIVASQKHQSKSLLEEIVPIVKEEAAKGQDKVEETAPTAPTVPAVPLQKK